MARADANMLVPLPYDTAWTELNEQFNAQASPGATALPAPAAAANGAVSSAVTGAALSLNPCRSCLIIQNNSATGGPVLWFNFGTAAVVNQCFALQPGGSLVIAEPKACPKEAVYTTWSGAGTPIAAIYQNSDPELCQQSSGTPRSLSDNVGAVAWGYAAPPAPPPAPAPVQSVALTSFNGRPLFGGLS